jgi:hypothetical protein
MRQHLEVDIVLLKHRYVPLQAEVGEPGSDIAHDLLRSIYTAI